MDANIAIQTVPVRTADLEHFWERVDLDQMTPCAPRLWLSETTSAIRFFLSQKEIPVDEAELALRKIHGLRVEIIDEDEELCLRALKLGPFYWEIKRISIYFNSNDWYNAVPNS